MYSTLHSARVINTSQYTAMTCETTSTCRRRSEDSTKRTSIRWVLHPVNPTSTLRSPNTITPYLRDVAKTAQTPRGVQMRMRCQCGRERKRAKKASLKKEQLEQTGEYTVNKQCCRDKQTNRTSRCPGRIQTCRCCCLRRTRVTSPRTPHPAQ
jgi:hypothetical protein